MSIPSEPDLGGAGAPEVLGKVASPPNKESTCDEFFFWVRRDAVVERTQIVTTTSRLGGQDVKFYGLVTEVFRQGRPRSIAEACDGYDGDVDFEPPFTVPGVTFAAATILGTDPVVLAPPMEGSDVVLGGEDEARVAYAADEIDDEKRLAVGLVKNGGTRMAGPGCIDLDYLLGENGGHLNVNGVAGRGTKSSFLLHMIYLLERKARRQAVERPSDPDRLRVVPIILNVKNFDLFYIDRASTRFDADRHLADWFALGLRDPGPLVGAEFFAAQRRGSSNAVDTGRPGVLPYSWSLADVIRDGLFRYLFADDDVGEENFEGVALDIEDRLSREDRCGDEVRRSLNDQDGAVRTFRQLVGWVDRLIDDDSKPMKKHHVSTLRKFQRRLAKVVQEGDGVLRRDDPAGHPLDVRATDTRGPRVIDLHALATTPGLQRFVVAAIFRQLVEERTGGRAISGLRYLVMLDELNRFAPRGASDPITRLIETVAAEMRSQGIILLGAQQQASMVSTRVIENAGIRALGRSGTMEMNRDVWKSLGDSARRKAAALAIDEKLLVQDSFREPMLVRIPMPPWALNPREARPAPPSARVRDEFDE
jgi:DNA helicase HerA-like ATPase